jgi:translation initiation factor IF-2
MKDPERALADYAAALERKFDTPGLRYNRAAVYYTQGELDKALEDLKAAVQGDPENERYRWALGRVEQVLAQRQAAEEAKRQAEEEARKQAEKEAQQEAEQARQGTDQGQTPGESTDEQEDEKDQKDDEFINPL